MMDKQIFILFIFLWLILSGFRMPEEERHLGRKIPDITIMKADGSRSNLYSLLRGKPLVLTPIYTKCPSICGLISNGTKEAVTALGTLGRDFNMVSFSFDSTDTPDNLSYYQQRWKMDGETWQTVTSVGKSIRSLLASIGYEYDRDTVLKQFNHPALLVVLTPSGRISRFIYGVNPTKRDIDLAVMAAMAEQTRPGLFKGFYLRCFGYDPLTRTYKIDWRFIISTSAGIIIIFFVTLIFLKNFLFSNPEHVSIEKSG